jgi:hypothetical protein
VSAFTPLFAPGHSKDNVAPDDPAAGFAEAQRVVKSAMQQLTFLDPGQSVDLHRRLLFAL